MTHPIHSADAERPAFEAAIIAYWQELHNEPFSENEKEFLIRRRATGEYFQFEREWQGWNLFRAAAQVGANGAADEVLCGIVDRARDESDEWAKSLSYEPNCTESNADFCRRIIRAVAAAGAPAETPKPAPGEITVLWHDVLPDGHWLRIADTDDTILPGTKLAATIGAGEGKDAARLEFLMEREAWIAWSKDGESCRVFHRDEDGDTGPIMGWIPEAWAHDPREAIDKARAAMRSKTSQGEAG